jgi:polyferredoxin
MDRLPVANRFTAANEAGQARFRINLLANLWVRRLVESRWPLFFARALTLAGFVFTILAGIFGTPVGSHNFAIIFVWIAWWTFLKLAFIPLGGRSWCSVCPIPVPGEWLQQGGVIQKASRRLGLGLRWPRRLQGYGLQAVGFLLIGLFSAITLTRPSVTAWVLLGLILLAVVLSLVYERRAFCRYLCPIGGFTGLYAQTAPVEVRVYEPALCASHSEKTCYQACPWGQYPLALKTSANCGLCMECLRVCPYDNITLNIRPFGDEFKQARPLPRWEETLMALVMLGSGLTFAAIFIGHWGVLKNAAYQIGSIAWVGYAVAFLLLNLILLPGLFAGMVWVSQRLVGDKAPLRKAIANQTGVLLPLGLSAWIAFTLSFALPKAHFVVSVLNDPLGWGWSLLGNAQAGSIGDLSMVSNWSQVFILMIGLYWSGSIAVKTAQREKWGAKVSQRVAPIMAFCLGYTLIFLWLLVG